MDSPNLDEVLVVAKEAVKIAGTQIRAAWLQQSEVKATKSNATDLVTETDQRCEDLIISLLKQKFPQHQIIGEESAGSSRYELTDEPTWTIDPIDGTTNFVHRLALSCVIITFLHKREVLVGVVYDPMADELFWATRGGGAFVHSRGCSEPLAMRTSSTASIPQAVISMDPGYGRDDAAVAAFTAVQGVILRRGVRNIRVLGSTGLNMAYVACGRFDAAFEEGSWQSGRGPKIWDFSAGRLLVEEAGGVTRDIGAEQLPTEAPLDLMGRSFFCAGTASLASEVLETINEGHGHSVEPSTKRQKV